MHVALVTCTNPPQEDFDAPPLLAALRASGHRSAEVAWDDPAIAWDQYDAALLRSTWDYFHRLEDFLDWAARVASSIPLWNSLAFVRWNTHKFYLQELAAMGIPIAPTEFVPAHTHLDVASVLAARGWDAAVIKPAVSADAFATLRVERGAEQPGQDHLASHRERDMLVQRYLPTVVEPGERCLVFIDGDFSHAVRKRSLFRGGRHAGPEGVPVPAEEDEIALARRILACAGRAVAAEEAAGSSISCVVADGAGDAERIEAPLYARVDLLRDEAGTPHLMELELVEPSLFFDARAGSEMRLVQALESRARQRD